MLKIGELAKRAGCQVVTVRFYEKKGLLSAPERTSANYRAYGQKDMERLNFIRHCRRHGMSLEEIRELVDISENPENSCARVHDLLDRHIENIDSQIDELQQLKESLKVIRGECDGKGLKCGVLKNLHAMEGCAYCRHNREKRESVS